MTAYQRKIFAIIASAWLVDQVDVALLTFLLGSIVVAFGLTPTQAGQLAAMTFAGQLVGNILAGTASDRFGRKTVFQVTMVVWGLASLAAAAAWSLTALMVCRFLIGVGVGGEAPVAQAMVSEIVPANVRGKYIAFMEGFWAVGYVLSGAISFFILPYLGWRWAFVVVGLLSGVVLLVRRVHAGIAALACRSRPARGGRCCDDADGDRGDEVHRPASAAGAAPSPPPQFPRRTRTPIATLFSPEYRLRTVMAFGLWFFALIGFFGLNSWIAVLLKEKGFSIVGSVGFVTLITIGRHPRLLHGGAAAGEDRPQGDHGGFPDLLGGGRLPLRQRHGPDLALRLRLRDAVLHVRHVELPLRLHAGTLPDPGPLDRGRLRLGLRADRGDPRADDRAGSGADVRPGRRFPGRRGRLPDRRPARRDPRRRDPRARSWRTSRTEPGSDRTPHGQTPSPFVRGKPRMRTMPAPIVDMRSRPDLPAPVLRRRCRTRRNQRRALAQPARRRREVDHFTRGASIEGFAAEMDAAGSRPP